MGNLLQELRIETAINLRPVRVDTDKKSRADAATVSAEAGRIYLPANEAWVAEFLDEVCSYPASPHDDWLDAFTQAVNYLRGQEQGAGSPQAFINWLKREAAASRSNPPDPWLELNDRDNLVNVYLETQDEIDALYGGGGKICAYCRQTTKGQSYIPQGLVRYHVPCLRKQEAGIKPGAK